MSIYDNTITPTYLYIKQHSVTRLKYFGKTTRKDPVKYLGSGTFWNRHIKKHGEEFVETIWLSEPYTDTALLTEYALAFSEENSIVESKEWANLIVENGLDGRSHGSTLSAETRAKISASRTGKTCKPWSAETRAKISAIHKGRIFSDETKAKMSAARKGKPGIIPSAEIRAKISVANKGRIISAETKAAMSISAKNKPPISDVTRARQSAAQIGRTHSAETKAKMSAVGKTRIYQTIECPHCGIVCITSNFVRWHGDNCKLINIEKN